MNENRYSYSNAIFKISLLTFWVPVHSGQVWGLRWTKVQEAIFWTYCVVKRCFQGYFIYFSQTFHFQTLKHGKLTKKSHFEWSRALYNLSEIFWLQNMLIYFLKISFLKKLIISLPIKVILTLLNYLILPKMAQSSYFHYKI